MTHLEPLKVTYASTGLPEGHLSLCWNNHRSTFYHEISLLRQKDRFSDMTLACEGKFYQVHKLVLSICSEYFDAMLESTPCKHPVIVLRDVQPQDLEALLSYMYEGVVSVSQNDLGRLIKTAEMLKIKGLAVPDDPLLLNTEGRRTTTSIPLVTTIPVRQVREGRSSPQAKRKKREESLAGTIFNVNNTNCDQVSAASSVEHYVERHPRIARVDSHRDTIKEVNQSTEMVVAEAIVKNENMDSDHLAKGATLISTYGVVVSDGGTHHTLVSHPQDPSQVITHRYDASAIGPGSHSGHSQPLAEAVAEALAGPSGMQSWLNSGELVPASFATVEHFTTEQSDGPSTQTIVHTLENSQSNSVNVSTAVTSISASPPIIVENSVITLGAATSGTTATNSTGSSKNSDGHLKCHFCNRATFRQTSDLKRHIRIHTGEKPYKCSFCPYKASRKDLLHAHCTKMHNAN